VFDHLSSSSCLEICWNSQVHPGNTNSQISAQEAEALRKNPPIFTFEAILQEKVSSPSKMLDAHKHHDVLSCAAAAA
jgi:formamidopyrimidine-DNA glycosylase